MTASDAISPAFEHTKRLLFQPFRLGVWARIAVIALATGEFAGGGGAANANLPSGGGSKEELLARAGPLWERLQEFLPWIVFGAVAVVALVVIVMYVASVFRFILLDAVLRDRHQIGGGWRRWQESGGSYFLWQVGFLFAFIGALAALGGAPVLLAYRAGVFRQPDQHVGVLVLGGLALFFLVLGLVLATMLIAAVAKDFVVPLMALENLRVLEGWRRLLPLLAVEKWAYAGYVLMKIVLAVGSAILFGIINLIVFLIVFIVFGIAGAALLLGGKAVGLEWNFYTIAAAVLAGGVVLAGLLYVISFVSSPAVVFFQAYALHFFSGRYPLLAMLLQPPLGAAPSGLSGTLPPPARGARLD